MRIYTVVRKTTCYVTFEITGEYGTFQGHIKRKISSDNEQGEYVYLNVMHGYLDASNEVAGKECAGIFNSNGDKINPTATPASETDTTTAETATPAETVQQDTDNITRFEVGKTYRTVFTQKSRSWGEKRAHTIHYNECFTIIERDDKSVTVRNDFFTDHATARRTVHISNDGVEYINPEGTYGAKKRLFLFATQIDTELSARNPQTANVQNEPTARFEVGFTYFNKYNDEFTVITRSNQFITVKEKNGDTHRAKIRYNGDISPEYAEGKWVYGLSADNVKQQDIAPQTNTTPDTATLHECTNSPADLDESFSDHAGDNSSPLQDTEIDHVHEDTPPVRDCFTIVPSEHIQRPDYASYPDTIPDDIPFHVIPAIDTPQHAAVVTTLKPAELPRVNAAIVSTWLHFIAFFLRLWLASNIRLSFSEAIPVIFPELPRKNSLHKFAINTMFYVSMGDGFTHYMTVIARGG